MYAQIVCKWGIGLYDIPQQMNDALSLRAEQKIMVVCLSLYQKFSYEKLYRKTCTGQNLGWAIMMAVHSYVWQLPKVLTVYKHHHDFVSGLRSYGTCMNFLYCANLQSFLHQYHQGSHLCTWVDLYLVDRPSTWYQYKIGPYKNKPMNTRVKRPVEANLLPFYWSTRYSA